MWKEMMSVTNVIWKRKGWIATILIVLLIVTWNGLKSSPYVYVKPPTNEERFNVFRQQDVKMVDGKYLYISSDQPVSGWVYEPWDVCVNHTRQRNVMCVRNGNVSDDCSMYLQFGDLSEGC